MPETEVETPAPPANETVKEEAVKADADNATEEKKDEEKPSEETKTKEAEAKEPKPKKEKKPKEPAPPPPPAVHKKDFEKEVVYVYQFNRTATVPSISPACLKLETWLKLNGIKFEVKISKRRKFSFLSRLMDGPQRCHPCLLAFFFGHLGHSNSSLSRCGDERRRLGAASKRGAAEVVIASAFSQRLLGLSQQQQPSV